MGISVALAPNVFESCGRTGAPTKVLRKRMKVMTPIAYMRPRLFSIEKAPFNLSKQIEPEQAGMVGNEASKLTSLVPSLRKIARF